MINQATIDLVKEFEGLRTKAYKDSAGVWTIGYGTTARAGLGIEPAAGMEITEAEAEYYLQKGLEKFSTEIAGVFKAPINENQFGACVSLAYNIGPGAFKRSSVVRHFNLGNTKKAADSILMWNKAGGKVLKGLVRRREAERALFTTPVRIDESPVEPKDRSNVAKSTTVQASAVQMVSGGGAAVAALGALDGRAQIIALIFVGVTVLAAAWIMRERIRKWGQGDR